MRDVDSHLGHHGEFLVVNLNTVGDCHVITQDPQLGEVDHRALTELGNEAFRVHLRRRHVETHAGAVLVSQLPSGLPERIGRCGVTNQGRPRAHPGVGNRTVVNQLLLQHVDCCIGVLLVDVGFWGKVPHPITDSSADADFDESVDDLVEETDRSRFEKGCRA